MDAIIKITAGAEAGQQFTCSTPETIIGRSPRCSIRLSAASISYEHALIARVADDFFIENLSANGTYLNNERITTKTRLRPKDQLRFGDETTARVESLPASARSGSSRTLLLGVFVVLLVVALAVVMLMDPLGGDSTSGINAAYIKLLDFTQQEIAANRLPRETKDRMQEAWRLETANDRENAQKAWLALQTTLDSADKVTDYQESSRRFPHALDALRNPDGHKLSDEEMGAALVQFAQRMEKRS